MLKSICYTMLMITSIAALADEENPPVHEPLIVQTCSVVLQNRNTRVINETYAKTATHTTKLEARRLAIALAQEACNHDLERFELADTHFCTLHGCEP